MPSHVQRQWIEYRAKVQDVRRNGSSSAANSPTNMASPIASKGMRNNNKPHHVGPTGGLFDGSQSQQHSDKDRDYAVPKEVEEQQPAQGAECQPAGLDETEIVRPFRRVEPVATSQRLSLGAAMGTAAVVNSRDSPDANCSGATFGCGTGFAGSDVGDGLLQRLKMLVELPAQPLQLLQVAALQETQALPRGQHFEARLRPSRFGIDDLR